MKNKRRVFGLKKIIVTLCLMGSYLFVTSPVQAGFPSMIFPSDRGITLAKGNTYTILWKSVRLDRVSIQLCTNEPEELFCFLNIARDIPNNDSYTWTVPTNLANGSNYEIIVGTIGVSLASSKNTFTISDTQPVQQLPSPPTLTLSINGLNVTAFWNQTSGADRYILSYADFPYKNGDPIQSVDMGSQTSFSINLLSGAAFYVAIQAVNGSGSSEYSNVELFVLSK